MVPSAGHGRRQTGDGGELRVEGHIGCDIGAHSVVIRRCEQPSETHTTKDEGRDANERSNEEATAQGIRVRVVLTNLELSRDDESGAAPGGGGDQSPDQRDGLRIQCRGA